MNNTEYQIIANGRDITQLIADRFMKLTISDAAGEASDSITLELDNRDGLVTFPPSGASLQVLIGSAGKMVNKGLYEVDEISEPLQDYTLTVHAKAAKMKGSIKAPKNATFDDITLGELVEKIASAHGYSASVAEALKGHRFTHIDQKAESDMNLLTRLARDLGAVAKPVADKLLVLKKGEAKSASGKTIEPLLISDPSNSSGTVARQMRGEYSSVSASWFDEDAQQKRSEIAGQGDPAFVIRKSHPDQDSAKKAAAAKLQQLQRGTATLDIDRPLTPQMVAEGQILLINHKASANGLWTIETVNHVISVGAVSSSSASCQKEPGKS